MRSDLDNQLSKLRIDKARKRGRRGSAPWPWLVAAVIIVTGGFAGYSKVYAPVKVRTVRVIRETDGAGKGPALLTASGYVIARREVEVSAKIVGVIKATYVKPGDHVKKGDVLLRIEDREYQARVAAAKAQVAMLQAKVAELHSGSRPQEIAAADAQVAADAAALREAERKLQRIERLQKSGGVSREDLDRATANRDVAKARLDAESKNAELVRLGPRKEEVAAAEAQLREAQADLDLAEAELSYTVIRAPITGTILEKLAEQGELVTNTNFGGTRGAKNSVVTMADLTDLQVEVDVNEADLAKVKLQQPVEISLDSNPQRVYSGTVDEIAPQADRQKGTVQVKVRVRHPDASMKTEMSARVTFLGNSTEDKAGQAGREVFGYRSRPWRREGPRRWSTPSRMAGSLLSRSNSE